jgi:hypothetical protein
MKDNGADERTYGGDLESWVTRLEKARRELEDALLVGAVLDAKSAARMKEHAEPRLMHSE